MSSVAPFGAAFLLAVASSGSIAAERLARTSLPVEWLAGAAVALSALLVLMSIRGRGARAFVWQLVGIAAAVAGTHAMLHVLADTPLVEAPAQLVNDLVPPLVVVGLAWSLHARAWGRAILAGGALGLGALYAATEKSWHFDPFPGMPVQHLVVVEVLAAAAALLVFDLLWTPRRAA